MRNKRRNGTGAVDLFTLGFGAIVGVGWSITLNNLFITGGGPVNAMIGFLLAMAMFFPVALCFAELAPAIPVSGGVIAYAKRAFNDRIAFLSGWFLVMSYVSIIPWETIAVNDVVAYLVPQLKSGAVLYEIMGTAVYLRAVTVGLLMSAAIFLINWHGFQTAVRFQKMMTALLLIGSLICIVAAFFHADIKNLQPYYAVMPGKSHTTAILGVATMLSMAPFYFAGFDTVPQSVDSAKLADARKIGKVILLVLASAGLFYVLIFFAAGLMNPWLNTIGLDRPVLANLFLQCYPGLTGKALYGICMAATLGGLFTTWNGFFVAGSQLLYGMAKAGLLPRIFLRTHDTYGTPIAGTLFCTVIMLLGPFFGAGVLDLLTTLGSVGFVIGWAIACLSAVRLRQTEPSLKRPYVMPFGKVMGWTGFILCILMLLNCIIPSMPGYIGKPGMICLAAWTLLGGVMAAFRGKNAP